MNLSKHQFDELEMNMTPMIDVVFLLIIFFMLITDMTQQDLEDALRKCSSSVGGSDLERFEKWMDEFGSA